MVGWSERGMTPRTMGGRHVATPAEWIEGARLRTLPAAVAPILAGSATAWFVGGFDVWRALLCVVVALALQVGVNYSNDYSDGIRGTDSAERVGPQRLVGSGAAAPGQVRLAALGCFAVAALAGLVLVMMTGRPWLIAIGLACIVAAWLYTGGRHPYGYLGLGEVFVFVFFGLVATLGTRCVMTLDVDAATWAAACATGALSCAVLACNNLRDIPTDIVAGKRTLATRLGDRGTRLLYVALCGVAVAGVIVVAALTTWWALLGLAMLALLVGPISAMLSGATGLPLVKTLKGTGLANVLGMAGVFVGCVIGS